MGWGTIIRGAAALAGRGASSLGHGASGAFRTAATNWKGVAALGAGGYLACRHAGAPAGQGLARTGAEILFGDEATERALEDGGRVADAIGSGAERMAGAVDGITDAAHRASSALGAGGSTGGLVPGLVGTIAGFLSNLAEGNVSGLSLAGLLVAAMMVFGRFGWLGKVGGALLGLLIMSGNSLQAPRDQARDREARTPMEGAWSDRGEGDSLQAGQRTRR